MKRKKRHPLKITRVELTNRVAKQVGFTQIDVKKVVDAIFDTITEMLAEGKLIEIRRFGTFKTVKCPAQMRRNPRTDERKMCPEYIAPKFKPAQHVKDKVNTIADVQDDGEGDEG